MCLQPDVVVSWICKCNVIICPAQVQAAIGAKQAVAFDLTAACSGFVLALVTAAQFVRTGTAKHVLVIGADAMSRVVDWRDRGEALGRNCKTLQ